MKSSTKAHAILKHQSAGDPIPPEYSQARSVRLDRSATELAALRASITLSNYPSGTMEGNMEINWRHDIDQVLKDARAQQKPVLLDFSAAPM
jgi:hypothetical protein